MRRRYRKFVLQLYRRLRHPRMLKQNRLMKWFATHFLTKSVWRPTRHTLAGGAAIGLLVSSLLIPGQMPIAAFLCGILRVNIPIAMVMCWLSNPFTFAPMILWEISLGNWIMQTFNFGEVTPLGWTELTSIAKNADSVMGFFGDVKPWAMSLYLGGAVTGLVLAPVSYILVFGLWDLTLLLSHRRRQQEARDGAGKPAMVVAVTKVEDGMKTGRILKERDKEKEREKTASRMGGGDESL